MPIAAVASLILIVGPILLSAGGTLGYDYHAYANAAERLIHGQALYDPSVNVAGGFAIYLYPPPFVLLALPFDLLPGGLEPGAWIAAMAAAFLVGAALLPVRRDVRWAIVLLGGLSWPLAYSLKLGQVGPLLFLLFAAGWRWLDRPGRLGTVIALGTIVKLQPAILLGWAALTRRWRAIGVGARGPGRRGPRWRRSRRASRTWTDYVELLRRVSSPVTTAHNFTPGAIAFQLGVSEGLASIIQLVEHRRGALAFTVWVAVKRTGRRGLPDGRHGEPTAIARCSGTITRCCCCCRSPGCSSAATGGPP